MDCSESNAVGNKPQAIEKILHKYELEIRAHVKMEQEFKKIAEESEKRYETIKTEYSALSTKYNKMLDRLSSVVYENENLFDEIKHLRQFISNEEIKEKEPEKKHFRPKINSITKEKTTIKERTTSNDLSKPNVNKVKSAS